LIITSVFQKSNNVAEFISTQKAYSLTGATRTITKERKTGRWGELFDPSF